MMKFRNQKGFTLLEIMLVVLIIGIIALLALPRLLVTRQMARQHTCEGNQSALRTHLEAYKWDWGIYPDDAGTNVDSWLVFLGDTRYWPAGDPAPMYCPTGATYGYVTTGQTTHTKDDGVTTYIGADEYALTCPITEHQTATGF